MRFNRLVALAATFVYALALADVPTQHNDSSRTGANLGETTLNVNNVNWSSFGLVANFPVDGDVYAQPLYLPQVATPQGTRDLLLVATANNTLFAFDANANGDAQPLWTRAYGNAVPVPSDDFGNLLWTCQKYTAIHGPGLPPESARINFDNHIWYQMRQVGITGTPVVDASTNTIYFVTFSRDAKATHSGPCVNFNDCKWQSTCSHPIFTYHYFLHAVDVTSGAERPRSPIEIKGSVLGTSAGSAGGGVKFQPSLQLQRPALLLLKTPRPAIYIAFGGHGDVGFYHGWVFAYDLGTPQKQVGIYLDEADEDEHWPRDNGPPQDKGEQGGIWQSGQGPAADADGNVYVMSGNGSFIRHNFGDSFIKLRLGANGLNAIGAWSPTPNEMGDNDLGSGGPLIVEGGNLLVGGGKLGVIYLLDRNLNVQQQFRAVIPPSGSSCDVSTYHKPCAFDPLTPHIHGSPVYWKGSQKTFLYVWGENDCLRAYPLVSGKVPAANNQCLPGSPPPIGGAASFSSDQAPRPDGKDGMPGGILAVSANGNREGSAIVWAARPLSGTAFQEVPPGVLEAFDATNVAHRLWASEQWSSDSLGKLARFTPPTIAGGRVFMATFSHVVRVYGELGPQRAAARAVVTALSRNSSDESLYRVDADGGVKSTWWSNGGPWHPWFPIGPQGWAPPGAQVTPLSRNSSDASLYVIGNDSGVYTNWWSNGNWHDWKRIGTFSAPPGNTVAANSRNDNDASIYVVAKDGGVYSNYWSNGHWHDWRRIDNAHSSFSVPFNARIDVVSRDSSDVSLYVVGKDGGVYSNYWSNGHWHDWFRIDNLHSAFSVTPGSPVHALSRDSSDVSIYVVGRDGGVYSNYWSNAHWHDWRRIGNSFVAPQGAQVTPLKRTSSDASIYVVGRDGSVYSNWWSNGNWHDWFDIPFAAAAPGARVSPLSRDSSDASLYMMGADSIVHSTWWSNGNWHPWFTIN